MTSREKQAYLRGQELGVRKEWTRYCIAPESPPMRFEVTPSQLVPPYKSNNLLRILFGNQLYLEKTTGRPVEIANHVLKDAWAPSPPPPGTFHYPAGARLDVMLPEGLRITTDQIERISGLNESLIVAVANEELIPHKIPDFHDAAVDRGTIQKFFRNPLRLANLIYQWKLSTNSNGYSAQDILKMFIGATGSTNNSHGGQTLRMENVFFGTFMPIGHERPGWIVFVDADIFCQLFRTWIRILTSPAYETLLSVHGFIVPEGPSGE